MSYLRKNIADMTAYVPGFQPPDEAGWVKLNTNENPYPPSPAVAIGPLNVALPALRSVPSSDKVIPATFRPVASRRVAPPGAGRSHGFTTAGALQPRGPGLSGWHALPRHHAHMTIRLDPAVDSAPRAGGFRAGGQRYSRDTTEMVRLNDYGWLAVGRTVRLVDGDHGTGCRWPLDDHGSAAGLPRNDSGPYRHRRDGRGRFEPVLPGYQELGTAFSGEWQC